jgi:hypothetical protein
MKMKFLTALMPNSKLWSVPHSEGYPSRLGTSRHEPGVGHFRQDLTSRPLKFWPIYSYLIVYYPETKPVQIIRRVAR